jgi:hypothetical protein
MSKPLRSIRLTPKSDYARFTGNRGEIFYDPVNNTLRIFNSQAVGGEILATRTWVLANSSDFTVDSLRSNNDINIDINLADSTLRRWRFGEDGELTFPDGTAQTTAFVLGEFGQLTVPGEVYGKFFSLRGGNSSGTIGSVGYGGDRVEISGVEGVGIIGGVDELSPVWDFGTDGTLTTPGDIIASGDITGTSAASTLYLKAQPNSDTYIQLNNTVDSTIGTVANLEIRTDVSNTDNTWTFGTDGALTFPDATVQSTAWTGIPGPYTDDAAAESAGVAVGNPYYRASGQVYVRLS